MDLLKNKELLRGLLQQGDLLNTIKGGVIKPSVNIEENQSSYTIHITAPTVSPDCYDITLEHNRLIVFAGSATSGLKDSLPLFTQFFHLPAHIDLNHIEAVHDGKGLKVVLPFHRTGSNIRRKINIKNS